MNRYTIAVLVRNQFGVLNRVTSMFRRRQFNITALTVSETESNQYSRITVVFSGDALKEQQLISQLQKLPDVCSIRQLHSEDSISCELLLIKMANEPSTREEIRAAASAFGTDTVDYSQHSMVFRLTDTSHRIDDFLDFMRDYTILEICRTGCVSLQKGSATLRQDVNE